MGVGKFLIIIIAQTLLIWRWGEFYFYYILSILSTFFFFFIGVSLILSLESCMDGGGYDNLVYL